MQQDKSKHVQLKKGLIFSGKYLNEIRVEILNVDTESNQIKVFLTKEVEEFTTTYYSQRFEEWNLQIVKNGFENGEYCVKDFPDYPEPLCKREEQIHSFYHTAGFVIIVKARSAMEAWHKLEQKFEKKHYELKFEMVYYKLVTFGANDICMLNPNPSKA